MWFVRNVGSRGFSLVTENIVKNTHNPRVYMCLCEWLFFLNDGLFKYNDDSDGIIPYDLSRDSSGVWNDIMLAHQAWNLVKIIINANVNVEAADSESLETISRYNNSCKIIFHKLLGFIIQESVDYKNKMHHDSRSKLFENVSRLIEDHYTKRKGDPVNKHVNKYLEVKGSLLKTESSDIERILHVSLSALMNAVKQGILHSNTDLRSSQSTI